MDAADEGELVRRIARGDRPAFDELYRRTAPWLEVRLHRRCADTDLVAEVLQDTYLAVWRAAGSFAGARVKGGGGADGSAVGWLWTIAAHRLVDAFRRRARNDQVPRVRLMPTAAPAAEDEVMAARVGQELEQALLALSPEVRAALRATVLDGLSMREASVLLGVPENTVKSRVRRARIFLREALS
ncbi:sigma-70 family RNA polymerase sigma factor [Solwaraspora sp. WMMD1047]|uniref:RNA polymerase sigma factor n=1 Tax=Solwaraspora sp. WMMD1047 TaxID=3016102 RepID=UPI002415D5C8|nr:sigma-70 family RNA polymerase sigma factor [Solwaraspora sp. WMMD1047]MDG4830446.1 sigma-70 family RNA polymerase sigma factor [Solwaraspora sp. WMMD1047]